MYSEGTARQWLPGVLFVRGGRHQGGFQCFHKASLLQSFKKSHLKTVV